MDKLQETVCLAVFRAVFRHCSQYWLSVIAEHGEFNEQRGIEHCVSLLAIWGNPLLLSLADTRPLADGLAGGEGTLVVVPDNATEETVIAGRNPVVVIQGYAGQS